MKKLLIVLFLFFSISSYAQSVGVIYNGTEVEDTLVLPVTDLQDFNVFYLDLYNKSTRAEEVKVRKETVSALPGSANSFCFGSNCFEIDAPEETIHLDATDTFSFASDTERAFHISYYPNNQIGKTILHYTFYNSENATDTRTIVVVLDSESPLAIADAKWNESVKIYPNPTTGFLHLTVDDAVAATPVTATLLTMNGRQVKNINLQNIDNVIDMSNLAKGSYLLLLNNGQEKRTLKIVKQ